MNNSYIYSQIEEWRCRNNDRWHTSGSYNQSIKVNLYERDICKGEFTDVASIERFLLHEIEKDNIKENFDELKNWFQRELPELYKKIRDKNLKTNNE